jgi:hypothetical protein
MGKGDDPHVAFVHDIDDEVRETVDQIPARAVLVERPSTGRPLDELSRGLDLLLKVQAKPRTSVFIKLHRLPQLNLGQNLRRWTAHRFATLDPADTLANLGLLFGAQLVGVRIFKAQDQIMGQARPEVAPISVGGARAAPT